ncbi:MAG: hypothetical protein K0S79_2558 [Nitrospira sp.]|nr:hypothetical protein [Nitrospira sp.]
MLAASALGLAASDAAREQEMAESAVDWETWGQASDLGGRQRARCEPTRLAGSNPIFQLRHKNSAA